MLSEMIIYIEDPSKIKGLGGQDHSFMASSIDEVRSHIRDKFAFLG